MNDWSRDDVSTLTGVGPKLKEKLARLGIENKRQLLFHLPLRYEDRTRLSPLGSLQPGQHALIQGEILHSGVSFRRRRVLVVKLADGSGFLNLRFFHFNASQHNRLQKGNRIRCFGEVRWVTGALEMIHPEYQLIDPDAPAPLDEFLTPVYPVTEGLHQLALRKLMAQVLEQLKCDLLPDTLPQEWLKQNEFPNLADALQVLHNPRNRQDAERIQGVSHPAQIRFIIEELCAHRLSLLQRRQQIRLRECARVEADSSLQHRLRESLGFQLTGAQNRVIEEIMADFRSGKPMIRLLQGDVGCGKTIVAAMAALPVIGAGYQCAMMAPTEILAQQHAKNFINWFRPLGIEVVTLMGADKGKKRHDKAILIERGEVGMVIGTHALFQASVEFNNLALIMIDEQHRFGVDQRQALHNKSLHNTIPHQLIMTATPIPRTLARSIYADLDYSQIDELPPGRTPVTTSIIADSKREELIDSVRKACAEGRQVYWVCTLIDESEVLQCEAAENTYEKLTMQLTDVRIGLVHGRMKSADKDAVVAEFKAGGIQLLVATTVIEVGVDVANASIMIIENPERLGLAQIHQLRGRVGRGSQQSFCLLLVKNNLSQQSSQRLEVIRNNQDGFVIAERDLEQRGAGEVLGTRQTGEASFRIANLLRDKRWFAQAEQLARLLMQAEYPVQRQQLVDNWIGNRAHYSDIG